MAIILDHYATLYKHDAQGSQKMDFWGLLQFLGIPAVCSIIVYATGSGVQHVPEVLSAIAILTGLTFNVFVLLFDLTMRAIDKGANILTGPSVAQVADELRANASYAVLLGLGLSALLGGIAMFADTSKPINTWFSCIIVFLAVQILLALGMALKRVRSMFESFRTIGDEQAP
ncbi:hypothetical protein [Actinomadura sp. WAC 06369]|uniref:hypothetical protein n=1 Tax=Actinomadura sp. WAC 06369 TaxID=2203193 RepID=UPI000F7B3A06|nr:hypothetical protein [Actinomadura sp. WAC 06369]